MKKSYFCPLERTLEVLGPKWRIVILWWIKQDVRRFSDLKVVIPGISDQELTRQLRSLEHHGIIMRRRYQERPPRVEYSITTLGKSLDPVIDSICDWGLTNSNGIEFGYKKALESLQ
ncbi:MAG: helix-turn-helix transcriptional regulator [Leptolyngbya sp.]|nr:helix-turn-helix transcriptional regulator [Candidatus Melainabacteria bacterium]